MIVRKIKYEKYEKVSPPLNFLISWGKKVTVLSLFRPLDVFLVRWSRLGFFRESSKTSRFYSWVPSIDKILTGPRRKMDDYGSIDLGGVGVLNDKPGGVVLGVFVYEVKNCLINNRGFFHPWLPYLCWTHSLGGGGGGESVSLLWNLLPSNWHRNATPLIYLVPIKPPIRPVPIQNEGNDRFQNGDPPERDIRRSVPCAAEHLPDSRRKIPAGLVPSRSPSK